jgi:catechol 2,3-dioxygenase-like lactoylglutathione lyase family enzyme
MLLSLPAFAALPLAVRVDAQGRQKLQVRALNHMTLSVSDVKRSLEFYQGLLGLPIQARQGNTVCLRIGDGPQFMALSQVAAGAAPHINHFCFTVEDFNVDRALSILAGHGVTKADASGGGLGGGPMKARVRMRGPEAGGAKEGTPELYFGDPDGIVVQLQDVTYCGGAGVLGNVCRLEPPPSAGVLPVRDLSHFTIMGSDAQRANRFYQDLFGFPVQANQGASPLLGVGGGVQFVMFTGGGAARGAAPAPPRPPRIDHACLGMQKFNVDDVQKKLTAFGIKPRGSAQGAPGPLVHYISMRMENRGGAKEGTPELYFTDPDGIPIQLQDVSYCGGGGVLGDVCPS